eukprot:1148295-Pelagomonas_calceolata.AAC.4
MKAPFACTYAQFNAGAKREPSVSTCHEGCCPASLVFDPVLPQEEIKALQELMPAILYKPAMLCALCSYEWKYGAHGV